MAEFHDDWLKMIYSVGSKNMPWGIKGGNGWISYRQNNDNDFSVQIYANGKFEDYKKQKNAVIDFFRKRNSVLISEKDIEPVSFGYYKQLEFIDNEKYEEKIRKEKVIETQLKTTIQTQINGNIDTKGGSFNTGNADNIDNKSINSMEDEKWFQKEIVKMVLSFISGIAITLITQWLTSR